jgi:hypothetical protein
MAPQPPRIRMADELDQLLSPTDRRVLEFVEGRTVYAPEIVEALGISPALLIIVADRLEALGLARMDLNELPPPRNTTKSSAARSRRRS